MDEKLYISSNEVKVKYKHKKRKYDFNHIIFVFSGFLNASPGNYDFINALNDCPCDVIWIGDDFDSKYAYYLCKSMDFSIRDAVAEFIDSKISELGLLRDNATVTGFSKGGSAALYFGLYLDIKNIVATVPQLKIGSYLDSNWKNVANHIMGTCYNNAHISHMDKLLINLLKKERNLHKNIYLLTSESDVQYKTEIEPYLNDFAKYSNFNLLKTYSAFVREHNQVTGHHTALLLSIYYALASEATPRFEDGKVNFFGSQPKPVVSDDIDHVEPYIDLRYINYNKGKLFIDGIGVIRGIHIGEFQDVEYSLIFQNESAKIEKKLAKVHRPNMTRQLFDGNFVVYDKAVFTTYQHNGLIIEDVAPGKYQLYLQMKTYTKTVTAPIVCNKEINFDSAKLKVSCNRIQCWAEIKNK